MTDTATLDLDIGATGTGTIEVDGHDVSKDARGFDVKVRANQLTEITLHLGAFDLKGSVRAHLEKIGVIAPRPDREFLAEAIAKRFPALLAQYSQYTVADFLLQQLDPQP